MTEAQAIGTPHPDDREPNVFTGTDPHADVGEPGFLGGVIGIPAPPGSSMAAGLLDQGGMAITDEAGAALM